MEYYDHMLQWMTSEHLSLQAKGALAHLVALKSAGEPITMARLLLEGRSGRNALNSALRELEERYCITRIREKTGAGMMAGYHWELFPTPECPF